MTAQIELELKILTCCAASVAAAFVGWFCILLLLGYISADLLEGILSATPRRLAEHIYGRDTSGSTAD